MIIKIDPSGPSAPQLRLVRPNERVVALGMAVAFFMTDPVFARLPFGHWSRVLVGQIKRKHFVFILRGETVVGFAGWALASRENAEDWLTGRKDLSFEDSQDGEIIVVNAWKATTEEANRALLDLGRRLARTKTAIYYKRYYADGRTRPVRIKAPRR